MKDTEKVIRCAACAFRLDDEDGSITTCKVYSRWVGACNDCSFNVVNRSE